MSFDAAMRLAVEQAELVKGGTYPNPPVGAVILDRDGEIAGVGANRADRWSACRGGGAAPGGCARRGRHGRRHPRTVQPSRPDAAVRGRACRGGRFGSGLRRRRSERRWRRGERQRLAASGVKVAAGVLADDVAGGTLREWLHKQRTGNPHVTWKFATSIDGRSAAADGSSQWITSEAARADVHRRRAACDAIVVGTGTVFIDDPDADGPAARRHPRRTAAAARGRGGARNLARRQRSQRRHRARW